jgi:hypothetical protein
MRFMSDTVVASLMAGGFLVIGLWLGSRSERRQWLRDARREAYMDYASAVHEIQSTEDDADLDEHAARQHMHRALTALALVGPERVVKACDDLSPVLRARPIDMVDLHKRYDEFIARAVVALAPSAWYRWQMRFARPQSDDEYRAEITAIYPDRVVDQQGPEAASEQPPSESP